MKTSGQQISTAASNISGSSSKSLIALTDARFGDIVSPKDDRTVLDKGMAIAKMKQQQQQQQQQQQKHLGLGLTLQPGNCRIANSNNNNSTEYFITELGRHDVLLGRGTGPNEHIGNRVYRNNIDKMKDTYMETTSRRGKDEIVIEAVNAVKAAGGRFVKKIVQGRSSKKSGGNNNNGDLYVIADHDTVIEKTRQAFQYCCRRSRKQQGGKDMKAGNASTPNAIKETTTKKKVDPMMACGGGNQPLAQGKATQQSQSRSSSAEANAVSVPRETNSLSLLSPGAPLHSHVNQATTTRTVSETHSVSSTSTNGSSSANQQAGGIPSQVTARCVSPRTTEASAALAALATQLASSAATSGLTRNLSSSQHPLPNIMQVGGAMSNEAVTSILLAYASSLTPSSPSSPQPSSAVAAALAAAAESQLNNIHNTRLLASLVNQNPLGSYAALIPILGFPGVNATPRASAPMSAFTNTSLSPLLPIIPLLNVGSFPSSIVSAQPNLNNT